MITRFSDRDIVDWRSYERVRLTGRFNMFDPRAREMTGMTRERYIFILEQYSNIQDQIAESKIAANIDNMYE